MLKMYIEGLKMLKNVKIHIYKNKNYKDIQKNLWF